MDGPKLFLSIGKFQQIFINKINKNKLAHGFLLVFAFKIHSRGLAEWLN
jgi:hypothetical protein